MAKRKKHAEEELPFVALMDTMTNVVGVLLIVLVMVGISISSSVKKILSDLPPITVEEFQTLVQQLKDKPKDAPTPEVLAVKAVNALRCKDRGNEHFRKGELQEALGASSEALVSLPNDAVLVDQLTHRPPAVE